MAIYEYLCHECCLLIEKDYPFAKNPKVEVCPECSKLCEQNWAGRDIPVHFKGAGWTGRNARTGFNKTGGSDEINKNLQEQSKERMKTGWQQYAVYTPPAEIFEKSRKLTDVEVKQKIDAAKEIGTHIYNKAKIDPTKINKPQ